MAGNTKLIEYGIQNEESDVRAHVCVLAKRVYIYETSAGRKAIDPLKHRPVEVKTKGIVTAKGYLVPPQDIKGVRIVEIPASWSGFTRLNIEATDSTAIKGDKATLIVRGLIITNKFLLFPGVAKEVTDHVLQVKGVDIRVVMNIQVKCDFRGGHKEYGGTGNLFLQTMECNPFKQYGQESVERKPKPSGNEPSGGEQ